MGLGKVAKPNAEQVARGRQIVGKAADCLTMINGRCAQRPDIA